jgi:uncharacterized protein (TIGR00725 family)
MKDKKDKRRIKNVTILGYSEAKKGDGLYEDAFEMGKLLAENGYTVINGGGPGVMQASSEGAKEGGGQVVGVTFYPKDAAHFEGRDEKNPLDKEIVAKNYLERTLKLLELGDVYMCFNGGTGTISEFGMAWGISRIYFGKHKPLILFGDFWHEVIETFGKNMLLRPDELAVYRIVTFPQEALVVLEMFEEELARRRG